MTALKQLDEYIFFMLNDRFHSVALDFIVPYWRSMYFWIPLYTFFIIYLAFNFRKDILIYLLFLIAVITVSDTASSKIIKPFIHRVRPCNDEIIVSQVKLLVSCGSGFSFPSSHATNHFAGVIFVVFTLRTIRKTWKWVLIFWAASIALGQVYVGVHYPSDILAGAALGSLLGFIGARSYNHWFNVLSSG